MRLSNSEAVQCDSMTQEQAKANSLIKYVSCLAAACLLMMPRIVSAQEVEPNALTDDFERDRLAILAMAGEYEVSFSFEETVALQAGYLVHEPHRSRGRELVLVIEDRGDFVSLQHLLVIDTTESGDAPISMRDEWDDRVVKHWRQDWTYQDTALLAYAGFQSWGIRRCLRRWSAARGLRPFIRSMICRVRVIRALDAHCQSFLLGVGCDVAALAATGTRAPGGVRCPLRSESSHDYARRLCP
jgi:hypothetical protein